MVSMNAAGRQALGVHFTPAPDEDKKVSALKRGKLTMPPHKTWTLPEHPTWSENPFSDNNWQFQYHMLRWLDPLRRAGAAGDAEAARLWEFWARSWIESNPPGSGVTKWAWIDMSDGIRAMELCHGLTVVGEQKWLVDSLWDHVDWLTEASHLKRGNHGFHQHVGLFVLGAVLEDQSVLDLAVERLTAQFEAAYDEQGVNEEGAVSYHLQNYVWWNDALTRLDLEGIPRPQLASRLELAPSFLAHATSPLGTFARIGDTDGSDPRRVDHPWTQFVVSKGEAGARPDSTTAVYDAGYAFMRSGWGEERPFREETYVTATWGRQDKVHGHRDGSSVTFASKGVQWIDDSGKYYYGKSPMRTYVVGRGGHNAIVIPGDTYRKDTEVDLLGLEETDDYAELAFSDAGYKDVSIIRRLIYLKHFACLYVMDKVTASRPVTVEQRWHTGREVQTVQHDRTVTMRHGDREAALVPLQECEVSIHIGETGPMKGWTSTGWRKKAPVAVVSHTKTGEELHLVTAVGSCPESAMDDAAQVIRTAEDPLVCDARALVGAHARTAGGSRAGGTS